MRAPTPVMKIPVTLDKSHQRGIVILYGRHYRPPWDLHSTSRYPSIRLQWWISVLHDDSQFWITMDDAARIMCSYGGTEGRRPILPLLWRHFIYTYYSWHHSVGSHWVWLLVIYGNNYCDSDETVPCLWNPVFVCLTSWDNTLGYSLSTRQLPSTNGIGFYRVPESCWGPTVASQVPWFFKQTLTEPQYQPAGTCEPVTTAVCARVDTTAVRLPSALYCCTYPGSGS